MCVLYVGEKLTNQMNMCVSRTRRLGLALQSWTRERSTRRGRVSDAASRWLIRDKESSPTGSFFFKRFVLIYVRIYGGHMPLGIDRRLFSRLFVRYSDFGRCTMMYYYYPRRKCTDRFDFKFLLQRSFHLRSNGPYIFFRVVRR